MEATPAPPGPLRSASLLACLGGTLLLRAAAGGAGILVSLLLAQIGREGGSVPAWAVGLASALFFATELLGAPGFGVLSDRYGRRPFLLISPLLGGAAAALMLALPLLPVVLFSRLFQGLSTAASAPSSLGFVADASAGDATLRGRVMAAFEVTTVAGMISGWAAGGLLWDRLGLLSFIPILVIYGLSWLAFTRVREVQRLRRAERHPAPHVALLSALRLPGVAAFIPAWLAVNAILGAWFAHIGYQLASADDPGQLLVGGFKGAQVGLYAAVVGLIFLAGLVLWGQSLGRLGALRSMRFGLVGMFALCPALYLLNHAQPHDVVRITVALACSGLALLVASGFTPAALAHLADISETEVGERGAVMGLYSVLLGLGQLLGAMIAAPFVDVLRVDGLILLTLLLAGASAAGVAVLGARHEAFIAARRPAPAPVQVEVDPS